MKPFPQSDWYLFPTLAAQGLRFEMPYQERLFRVGQQLRSRLHEQDINWWDRQLNEYEPLPTWHDIPHLIKQAIVDNLGGQEADYPFWLLTARSMQYSWGANVGVQVMAEVAENVKGHRGIILNTRKAAELGVRDGDEIEVRSAVGSTRGPAILRQGIRPDTLLMVGQFDHWATPFAKDLHSPSMNSLVPMLLDLTDSTGSAADIVPVAVSRVGGRR